MNAKANFIATIVLIPLFILITTIAISKLTKDSEPVTKLRNIQEESRIEDQQMEDLTIEESKYEFINSKEEVAGSNNNKMDLYTYSGDFDLNELKELCENKKQEFTIGTFYFLVVFDNAENAEFPQDAFTASYGLEENTQKHIKALYTFNRLNGYSELDYYEFNKWESVSMTEEI